MAFSVAPFELAGVEVGVSGATTTRACTRNKLNKQNTRAGKGGLLWPPTGHEAGWVDNWRDRRHSGTSEDSMTLIGAAAFSAAVGVSSACACESISYRDIFTLSKDTVSDTAAARPEAAAACA